VAIDESARVPETAQERVEREPLRGEVSRCREPLLGPLEEEVVVAATTTAVAATDLGIVPIGATGRAYSARRFRSRPQLTRGPEARRDSLGVRAGGFEKRTPPPGPQRIHHLRALALSRLARAGDVVGIEMVDHLVVGVGGAWVSLKERGGW
jgi:hypothetical protein